MKLKIAKVIYFGSLGILGLLALSGIAIVIMSIAPVVWALFGIGVCVIAVGVVLGWSEKIVEKESAYKISGNKKKSS